jgi:hypothetical protein
MTGVSREAFEKFMEGHRERMKKMEALRIYNEEQTEEVRQILAKQERLGVIKIIFIGIVYTAALILFFAFI